MVLDLNSLKVAGFLEVLMENNFLSKLRDYGQEEHTCKGKETPNVYRLKKTSWKRKFP